MAKADTKVQGLYVMSVAARLCESHPQTLRMYERMGLIQPKRTASNVRLYSDEDIERVRRIQHLTQGLGVNLAGVELVFERLERMERMRHEMDERLERMLRRAEQMLGREISIGDLLGEENE
jgi:MerR family transcriptional regulator/heat shock protein HspR